MRFNKIINNFSLSRTIALDTLRLEKWKVSLKDLLSDHKGTEEFEIFLKKEFSEENLRYAMY